METTPQRNCPSKLELAAHEADGTLKQLLPHAEACSRCQAVLDELSTARQELFGSSPEQSSTLAARMILARAEEINQGRRRRWAVWLSGALVPALGVLLLFVLQGGAGQPAGSVRSEVGHATKAASSSDELVRAKSGVSADGKLALRIYCMRGQEQFEVKEGADLLPGDRLRFVYSKASPGFITVFSVDDRGRIAPFYRDDSLGSQAVEAGRDVVLDGSVELDDHRGWERVFALWSEVALNATSINAAVARGLTRFGGDIRQMATLDLGAEQVSYLLRRP